MAKRFVKSDLYSKWASKSAADKALYKDSILFVEDRKFIIEGDAAGTGFVEFDGRTPVAGAGINVYELAKDGSTYQGKLEIEHAAPGTGSALSLTAGSKLTPAHGGTFDIITGISKDSLGHIVGATKQTVQLPTAGAVNDGALTLQLAGTTSKTFSANDADNVTFNVPAATNSAYGLIKLGYTESGKNYPLELDSDGKAFVNVPWDNTTTFNISAGATDDDVVILTGTAGTNGVSYDAKHAKKGPSAGYTSGNTTTSISGSGGSGTIKIPQLTVDAYGHVTAAADESVTITLPTIPTVNNGQLTIKAAGVTKGTFTANQSGNTTIDITAGDLGLTGAMHFAGVCSTLPTAADYNEGDVVVVTSTQKEYVLALIRSVKTWVELGNEGSHALNTVTVTGTGVLGGGGNLTTNRTITHNKVLGTATTSAQGGVSGNTITVPIITADEYGHLKTVGTESWTYTAPAIPTLKNVFGIVKVGSTSIEADSTRDTLELAAGTGITLTPDATNDKVTIAAVNNGTVTSVGLSAPTGFSVSGSPVTGSGTLALSFASGYSLPTTAKQGNWDTAYGWGNHASAGYVKSSGVTKVSTGAGLTGGNVTTTGTIKANLVSETKSTKTATASFNTASPYANAVSLDKNGKLMVDSSADWAWEVLS